MARKKSFRLPKLRHHKASNRGAVELSGKQHYLGRYGSAECQAAYDKLVGEWLASGKRPVEIVTNRVVGKSATGLAVVQLAERYLDHAANYYQSNGQPTCGVERVKMAARIVTERYAATPVTEFGPLKLRAIQEQLIEQDRSRRFINVHCGEIKRMFKWCVSMELCPTGAYHALQAVPGLKYGRSGARETKRILPVSEEALNATLPELGKIVHDMVHVRLLGAMRPQVVCMMRPADIDRKGDVWPYKPRHHKTAHYGRDRIIPLGAASQAILLPYLLRPAESYIFSPVEAEAQHRAARAEKRRTPIGYGNSPGTNRVKKPRRKTQRAVHRGDLRPSDHPRL